MVGMWLYCSYELIRFYKQCIHMFVGNMWLGIAIVIVLAIMILIAVPPSLRVFNDEINLVSVSRSMVFNKTPCIVTECNYNYGVQNILSDYIGKRPLIFPYALSIMHTAMGYRVENVFILNILVLAFFLYLTFSCMRFFFGNIAAISALLLILSHPIVSLSATSGGYDLMSASFIFLCLLTVWFYIKHPSHITFRFMFMSFMILSNIRYESILYFVITLCLLGVFRFIKREHLKGRWLYVLSIILLLPLLWQRILKFTEPQLGIGEEMFSVKHFIENNKVFFNSLMRFDFHQPYATIIFWLGGIAVVYLLMKIISNRFRAIDKGSIALMAITFAIIGSAWTVITSLFWSRCDDIVCARFYLPFCILFSIILSIGVSHLLKKKPLVMLLFCVLVFVIYHPIAIENRLFLARKGYSRNYRLTMNFMKSVDSDNEKILMIVPSPKQMVIHGFGAIGFSRANEEVRTHLYRLAHKLYKDIYVVQEIDYKLGTPLKKYRLSSAYKLLPVYEAQNRGNRIVRISKVLAND